MTERPRCPIGDAGLRGDGDVQLERDVVGRGLVGNIALKWNGCGHRVLLDLVFQEARCLVQAPAAASARLIGFGKRLVVLPEIFAAADPGGDIVSAAWEDSADIVPHTTARAGPLSRGKMNIRLRIAGAAIAVAAFLVVGCSGNGQEATPEEITSVVETSASEATITEEVAEEVAEEVEVTTQAPEPEPTYATESQVASVIAEYEPDWVEVIEGASDCRFIWVTEDADEPFSEGLLCHMRETTMSMTSETATKRLLALDIPPSMTDLVQQTLEALVSISTAGVDEECGLSGEFADTEECSTAHGLAIRGYSKLERALNAWSPYL